MMKVDMKCSKSAFEIEKKRDFLASSQNFKKLRETYNNNFPEITNLNTSSFWSMKSHKDNRLLLKSPIYLDKIKRVTRLLNGKKGKLLDVGIGCGYVEKRLRNSELDIFGIDISKTCIKDLKRALKGKFRIGEASNLPFKDSMFDYVLALDIFEHIPPSQIFKVWGEIHRVLKKDKYLIVSIPLNEGLEELIKNGENPNAHVRVYTPSILKAEMKLSGFRPEEEYYLYAFNRNYLIKSFITKLVPFQLKKPNLLMILGKKI